MIDDCGGDGVLMKLFGYYALLPSEVIRASAFKNRPPSQDVAVGQAGLTGDEADRQQHQPNCQTLQLPDHRAKA